MYSLARGNNEKLFISAVSFSRFGSVALTLFFNYWIVAQGRSATFLGIITSVMYLPNIVLSLVGGKLATKHSNRKLLLVFDIVSFFVCSMCFAVLSKSNSVFFMLSCASVGIIILNSVAALYGPVSRAFTPGIVKKSRTPQFNALYMLCSDGVKCMVPLLLTLPFVLNLNISFFLA